MLFLLFFQDIGHAHGAYKPPSASVSQALLSLAGFQVILIGRFWVIAEAEEQRTSGASGDVHPKWRSETVEKIVPVIPIWKAISHNRLMLAVRFHGVVNELHKEVDVGPLKMKGFAKAKIKLAGTRKMDGETLAYVSIRYSSAGTNEQLFRSLL